MSTSENVNAAVLECASENEVCTAEAEAGQIAPVYTPAYLLNEASSVAPAADVQCDGFEYGNEDFCPLCPAARSKTFVAYSAGVRRYVGRDSEYAALEWLEQGRRVYSCYGNGAFGPW